jgi:hypothetical protein
MVGEKALGYPPSPSPFAYLRVSLAGILRNTREAIEK